jgi:UDP-2,3-diacylglucosamine pyrophosphatase LpxH
LKRHDLSKIAKKTPLSLGSWEYDEASLFEQQFFGCQEATDQGVQVTKRSTRWVTNTIQRKSMTWLLLDLVLQERRKITKYKMRSVSSKKIRGLTEK